MLAHLPEDFSVAFVEDCIDGHAQQLFHVDPEELESEATREAREIDEQVDVAALIVVAPSNTSDDPHVCNAGAFANLGNLIAVRHEEHAKRGGRHATDHSSSPRLSAAHTGGMSTRKTGRPAQGWVPSRVILIDVDGVILPTSRDAAGLTREVGLYDPYDLGKNRSLLGTVVVSEIVLERVRLINKTAYKAGVQMCWLTSWSQHAALSLAPALQLGRSFWPAPGHPQGAETNGRGNVPSWPGADWRQHWKSRIALSAIDANIEICWIDDSLSESVREGIAEVSPGSIVVAPNPVTGLSHADTQTVLDWIAKC